MKILKDYNISLTKDEKILGELDLNKDGNPSMVSTLFLQEDLKVLEEILRGHHDHKFKIDTKFSGGKVTIYLVNRADGKNLYSHEVNFLDFYLEFKDKISGK